MHPEFYLFFCHTLQVSFYISNMFSELYINVIYKQIKLNNNNLIIVINPSVYP